MKLSLMIEMPEKRQEKPCPIEYVQDLIDECECGIDRKTAFEKLRKLFNRLAKSKQLTPKGEQIFEILEPWMLENGGRSDDKVETAASYDNGYKREEL